MYVIFLQCFQGNSSHCWLLPFCVCSE